MQIRFLLDQGNPLTPRLCEVADFNAFCNTILDHCVQVHITPQTTARRKKREKAKLYWFSSPVREAGIPRRTENMDASRFIALDIDKASSDVPQILCKALEGYNALLYHTASSTPDAPRLRIVMEYDGLLPPGERQAVHTATESWLMQRAGFTPKGHTGSKYRWDRGAQYAEFDRAVYPPHSYLYCPHQGAQHWRIHGQGVQKTLLPVTPPDSEPAGDTRAASMTPPDEYTIADLRSALWHPPVLALADAGCGNYQAWVSVGHRLASLKDSGLEDDARSLWLEWSAAGNGGDEQEAARKWDSNELCGERTGYRAIFKQAQQAGWRNPVTLRGDMKAWQKLPQNKRADLLARWLGDVAVLKEGWLVHRYNGKYWEYMDDTCLQRHLITLPDEHDTPCTTRMLTDTVNIMKLKLKAMEPPQNGLINFANGTLDISADQFRSHTPEDWLTSHNGIVWTPGSEGEPLEKSAPHFSGWLSHCFAGDEQAMAHLRALLYMVLTRRHDWQLFAEATGPGGTGKSLLAHITTMLAGKENTVSGSLKEMEDAGERAKFVGKGLILLPDQPYYRGEGAGLKAITGGDAVSINPKYKDRYSTPLPAVVLITGNRPLHFTGHDNGIARRRVLFTFSRVVEHPDPRLAEKIQAELPAIVRTLLNEFRQPETARTMLRAQQSSAAALEAKRESNPLYAFCHYLEQCDATQGMGMGTDNTTHDPRNFLRHAYLEYMRAQGHKNPLSLTTFGKALKWVLRAYGITFKKSASPADTATRYGCGRTPATGWVSSIPLLNMNSLPLVW